MKLDRTLRRAAGGILELLYPAHANCMGCYSPLGSDIGWLCGDCFQMLRPMERLGEQRCGVCGRFSPISVRCEHCADWPPDGVSRARFAYPYAPPVTGMIRRMKYTGVYRLIPWMAEQMELAHASGPFLEPDAVVPVPMHTRRLRTRGFNQAELLAKEFCDITGYPYLCALVRVRNTRQQARLDAAKRRENLAGAFRASTDVRGMRILLIDDVLTTGTTANQCARTLRQAGAAEVELLAFAGAE